MISLIEPVTVGIIVAFLNKYVISNGNLFYYCTCSNENYNEDSSDDVSGTSTAINDDSHIYHIYHTS